jgi:Flp pilus assembly pilin Flp
MNTIDRYVFEMMFQMKRFMNELIYDEDGAVDLVTIVVLIGIAVVLAVLFRTRIEKVLKTLFDTIDQNAESAVN